MLKKVLLLALAGVAQSGSSTGSDPDPVVRAVLFFSPTCPHCHKVIQEDLPWIFELFGGEPRVYYDRALAPGELAFYVIGNGRVEILLIDASTAAGNSMYRESAVRLGLPERRQGVPRLVVGDSVMVGALEIPAHFPDLIEAGLASGGTDWPAVARLDEAVAAVPGWTGARVAAEVAAPATTAVDSSVARTESAATGVEPSAGAIDSSAPRTGSSIAPPDSSLAHDPAVTSGEALAPNASASTPGPTDAAALLSDIGELRPTAAARFRRDPLGNGLAVFTLGGMIASVLAVVFLFVRGPLHSRRLRPSVPALALIGMAVAAYLSDVETSGAIAVCGPVGDCNAVQQSEYARLFGLPVGVLGLAGYVAMLATWLVGRACDGRNADAAKLALLLMAFIGTGFSIYLTFLEPFVIGATCAWCLTSAVILTLMMWLSLAPARESWLRLRESSP